MANLRSLRPRGARGRGEPAGGRGHGRDSAGADCELGERAFEIVLARRMAAGEVQTTWFERHGSTPITELPRHWPAAYRELVERRIRLIADDPNIRLIEQPEYKRRWNTEPWDEQFTKAARDWLLARLEGYFHEGQRVCELKDGFSPAVAGFTPATRPALATTNQLAGTAQTDAAFLAVAEAAHGRPRFLRAQARPRTGRKRLRPLPPRPALQGIAACANGTIGNTSGTSSATKTPSTPPKRWTNPASPTPSAPAAKPPPPPARKAELGDIPVPPKYASSDFKKTVWWSLRGKLDVPKERWISYPGAEPDGDPSPLIAWAGWDHLQQAQALAEYYLDAKSNHGWPATKLKLLLAGLLDLLPWLKQWHNEMDPDYGMGLGDYFEGFLDEECRSLDLTLDELHDTRFSATPQRLADTALNRA